MVGKFLYIHGNLGRAWIAVFFGLALDRPDGAVSNPQT